MGGEKNQPKQGAFIKRQGRTGFAPAAYVNPSLVDISESALRYLQDVWQNVAIDQHIVTPEGEELGTIIVKFSKLVRGGMPGKPQQVIARNVATLGFDRAFSEAGELALQASGFEVLFNTKRSAKDSGACEIDFDGKKLTIQYEPKI